LRPVGQPKPSQHWAPGPLAAGIIASDRTLPRSVHARLALALVIPVIGYADDAIVVCAVLRSVVKRAGPEAIRRPWPGTDDGLAALWRVAGIPSLPPS
jgi:hypothetical protein